MLTQSPLWLLMLVPLGYGLVVVTGLVKFDADAEPFVWSVAVYPTIPLLGLVSWLMETVVLTETTLRLSRKEEIPIASIQGVQLSEEAASGRFLPIAVSPVITIRSETGQSSSLRLTGLSRRLWRTNHRQLLRQTRLIAEYAGVPFDPTIHQRSSEGPQRALLE